LAWLRVRICIDPGRLLDIWVPLVVVVFLPVVLVVAFRLKPLIDA
jgi:hypothetical protein